MRNGMLSQRGLELNLRGRGTGFLPQVTRDYRGRPLTSPYRVAKKFTNVYHP
ncbi:hypothetical protein MPL1032_30024 [Mesorhizobium plurifarium]|uniref:Uncharacterized protein n=1 Tax=Mesorhizobium plurifarium TaxID=69974 RepID=A0A0K2W335_MESPL|nr:hypothetical protein MPL1032_30024 [Mesorhizobium plurifarium]